jgi:hypothetical protein
MHKMWGYLGTKQKPRVAESHARSNCLDYSAIVLVRSEEGNDTHRQGVLVIGRAR